MTPAVENMGEITAQLVEEAKKAGIKYIIKLSAMAADAEAELPPKMALSSRKNY